MDTWMVCFLFCLGFFTIFAGVQLTTFFKLPNFCFETLGLYGFYTELPRESDNCVKTGEDES